jgi:hypothetical protein
MHLEGILHFLKLQYFLVLSKNAKRLGRAAFHTYNCFVGSRPLLTGSWIKITLDCGCMVVACMVEREYIAQFKLFTSN